MEQAEGIAVSWLLRGGLQKLCGKHLIRASAHPNPVQMEAQHVGRHEAPQLDCLGLVL